MKLLRFYEYFACACATIVFVMLGCTSLFQTSIDVGEFEVFGLLVIALIYAVIRQFGFARIYAAIRESNLFADEADGRTEFRPEIQELGTAMRDDDEESGQ